MAQNETSRYSVLIFHISLLQITAELVMFLPECPEHFLIDVASHIERFAYNIYIHINIRMCVFAS